MKKRFVILFVVMALGLSLQACIVNINGFGFETIHGSGDMVSEERSVSGFNEVNFAGLGRLYIEFGDEESLTIKAEDNFLKHIETDVRGGKLVIEFEKGINLNLTKSINYYLTVVELEKIEVSGFGSIQVPEIVGESFSIELSGAGDIDIDGLEVELFEVEISGVGDLRVDGGHVEKQIISLSGVGGYSGKRLESEEAEVEISGLGSVTIRVSDHLEVDISGGGSVDYYGSPTVDSDISGVGDVDRVGN